MRGVAIALAAFAGCALAAEPSPPPGRAKAIACAPCHGPQGLSVAPDAPNLAGQPRIYLARQLHAYRSGERKHEVMGVMAKQLSDQDIAQLADWYASLEVQVKEPR